MVGMSEYNYSAFDMDREQPSFDEFPRKLRVGERAPDFRLEDVATGEPVSLRSLTSSGVALIEFGSFT